MECPRCERDLNVMTTQGVEVDVCFNGCGGIWFDAHELKKLDEKHEADPEFLKTLAGSAVAPIDESVRLKCPKCPEITMMRNFFSAKQSVEVDHCGNCAGTWLDIHELTVIHGLYETEAERKQAAADVFDAHFRPVLDQMAVESDERRKSAQKFARALRFLCPSWYMKGKQDWGAF